MVVDGRQLLGGKPAGQGQGMAAAVCWLKASRGHYAVRDGPELVQVIHQQQAAGTGRDRDGQVAA